MSRKMGIGIRYALTIAALYNLNHILFHKNVVFYDWLPHVINIKGLKLYTSVGIIYNINDSSV